MGRAEAAVERTSPEALFALSGITQYTGAVIAVRLFEDAPPTAVVWLRGLTAAVILLLVSGWWRQRWTRHDLGRAALFGVVTALMNLFFYLAIDRIPLGKSVVIEFVGPIALAAVLTRTVRNSVALVLAATGVIVLSGVEIDHEPLGLLFIAAASAMWAGYIVLGRRVAGLNRGTAGLAVSLGVGAVALAPVGAYRSAPLFTSGHLLGLAALVGLLSTAIPYGLDQYVMRRIPTRRFALLLALLPVTAMVVGLLALDQRPTTVDLIGAALVVSGVIVQERDELAPAEPPG
ncbi:MAG: EamA family transporter [Ilumatobacteraceae bacterium]